MSAPISPGGRQSTAASGSLATATSAPRSCTSAITASWSRSAPLAPGYCSSSPAISPSGRPSSRSRTITRTPRGSARVRTTAIVCGRQSASTTKLASSALLARRQMPIASAAAVASSSSDAFAAGRPLRSATIVWKFSSASSRPCEISGWYGRVGGVPGRVLEHLAQHDLRGVRRVVPEADHRLHDPVALADRAQLREHVDLGLRRWQIEIGRHADLGRHRRVGELGERRVAERPQHLLLFDGPGADVAPAEGDCVLELGERGSCGHGRSIRPSGRWAFVLRDLWRSRTTSRWGRSGGSCWAFGLRCVCRIKIASCWGFRTRLMVRPVEVSCLRPSGLVRGIPVGRSTCAASAGSIPVVWARGSPRLAT